MFENLSYLTLQQYWWFLFALLGALFVFMNFVQGGQTLLFTTAKNDLERDLIVNSLGRKWELGFTSLVMFGGALFAAFPLFYATSFGGAYYVWMAILFCFIIQAAAYEFRKKPNNLLGQRTYGWQFRDQRHEPLPLDQSELRTGSGTEPFQCRIRPDALFSGKNTGGTLFSRQYRR